MNQEKIGKFISERRKIKKLTQSELGSILGVSDKSVSKWENGKCMPDLSLFPELCSALDITINDLMSGKIVDDKEYIKTLEENIVKYADTIKKQRRKKIKIVIGFILLFLFSIWGYIIYNHYSEETIIYKEGFMNCNIFNKELIFGINGTSILNEYHTVKKLNGKDIHIFNFTLTRKDKDFYAWELKEGVGRIFTNNHWIHGIYSSYDLESDDIEVYYTEKKISKFEKASEKELKELLKDSHKMNCSHLDNYMDRVPFE